MAVNIKDLPRHHYTLEEYFALERTGQARYEYWDGEIICMSGGSRQHARICSNVHLSIGQRLKKDCYAYTGDLPIRTPTLPPYRYPDASVVCCRAIFENINGVDALTNPVLIVEVLSPGTENLDRKEKRAAYQAIPSVMEYLLISQDAPHITRFARPSKVDWSRQDVGEIDSAIELISINRRLSLREVYEGVDSTEAGKSKKAK